MDVEIYLFRDSLGFVQKNKQHKYARTNVPLYQNFQAQYNQTNTGPEVALSKLGIIVGVSDQKLKRSLKPPFGTFDTAKIWNGSAFVTDTGSIVSNQLYNKFYRYNCRKFC